MLGKNKKNFTVESYSASRPQEIAPFIKAFKESKTKQENIDICTNNSTGKKFFLKRQFSRIIKSNEFDNPQAFKNGFALVIDGNKKFYIDQSFRPVICEDKIKNGEDLSFLVLKNAASLLKYVSPEKILDIYHETRLSYVTNSSFTKKQIDSVREQIDIIGKFIKDSYIEERARLNSEQAQNAQKETHPDSRDDEGVMSQCQTSVE